MNKNQTRGAKTWIEGFQQVKKVFFGKEAQGLNKQVKQV